MSNSLYVRKTVMVNSMSIKAIRLILTKPGLGIDKVSILCGGPDWPTSVLTGILRLSVVKMLIGTLPVVFLVAPCVLSGAFVSAPCPCPDPPCGQDASMCKDQKDTDATKSLFKGLATVSLIMASLVQSLALFAAMYFIENASSRNRKELLDYPNDPDVEVADKEDEKKKKVYSAATMWSRVPMGQKINLCIMFFGTMVYCITFGTQSSKCFVPFEVTDSIEDKLNNNAANLIIGRVNSATGKDGYYIGWIMNGLVVVAYLQKMIFDCWAKQAVATVQGQLDEGLTLEDVVPEAFRTSQDTKVAPKGIDLDKDDEEEEEEDNDASCRQQ